MRETSSVGPTGLTVPMATGTGEMAVICLAMHPGQMGRQTTRGAMAFETRIRRARSARAASAHSISVAPPASAHPLPPGASPASGAGRRGHRFSFPCGVLSRGERLGMGGGLDATTGASGECRDHRARPEPAGTALRESGPQESIFAAIETEQPVLGEQPSCSVGTRPVRGGGGESLYGQPEAVDTGKRDGDVPLLARDCGRSELVVRYLSRRRAVSEPERSQTLGGMRC